jgi:hypothetical protein
MGAAKIVLPYEQGEEPSVKTSLDHSLIRGLDTA